MSIPVPLGVRIYDHSGNVDMWVTRWVEQLQFRSVIPGGFASASFRLHVPQWMYPVSAAWSTRAPRIPLVRSFNRVQIVDLRSGEIAWEGRIDSPARVEDDGFAWDIGCAGAMVSATDITKPVFYIDSSVDHWETPDALHSISDVYSWSTTDSPPKLHVDLKEGMQWDSSDTGGGFFPAFYHFLCVTTNQYLARFTITYQSSAPNVTGGTGIKNRANVYTTATDTWQNAVDSTALGAADTTKSNAVGGASSFTSTQAQVIDLDLIGPTTPVITPSSQSGWVSWANPIVIAMRVDRNGSLLTSSTIYGTDYVTVSQVVEDVLGRLLNNAWTTAGQNVPSNGSVGAANVYIDATDTTQITNLSFPDGATAADVLNQLMTVQTNAYWAIWESQNTATNTDTAQRFRFEWATWPDGWGYQASSVDGLDEQPDGSGIYNFVSYQHTSTWNGNFYLTPVQQQEWWDFTDVPTAPLLQGRLTRAATVKKDGLITDAAAGDLAQAWISNNGKEINTGAIIIKRPIMFYDAGVDSGSGAGRMVDPWMIRPGKLIRITDVPPIADIANINHGATAPPASHAGAVFKVIATEYDADENACRLELDQVTTWSLPGQILPAASSNVQTVVG